MILLAKLSPSDVGKMRPSRSDSAPTTGCPNPAFEMWVLAAHQLPKEAIATCVLGLPHRRSTTSNEISTTRPGTYPNTPILIPQPSPRSPCRPLPGLHPDRCPSYRQDGRSRRNPLHAPSCPAVVQGERPQRRALCFRLRLRSFNPRPPWKSGECPRSQGWPLRSRCSFQSGIRFVCASY
jgi:hypothetical protein